MQTKECLSYDSYQNFINDKSKREVTLPLQIDGTGQVTHRNLLIIGESFPCFDRWLLDQGFIVFPDQIAQFTK